MPRDTPKAGAASGLADNVGQSLANATKPVPGHVSNEAGPAAGIDDDNY
jgi:hypothetical protein